jgi:hypothetical protein
VTLPYAVTVGSTTLPSGQYTISSVDMAGGNDLFVMRSPNSPAVSLLAQRIDGQDQNGTQVMLARDGDTWRLDKLFIQGDDTGYQFVNVK